MALYAGGGGGNIDDRIAGAGVAASPGGGGGGSAAQDDPPVFMGGGNVVTQNERAGSVHRNPSRKDIPGHGFVKPMSEVADQWYDWDDVNRQQWAQHLIDAGVLDEEDRYDYSKLQQMWAAMVQESAGYTARGKQVSPWDAAVLYGGGDESGVTAASLGRAAVGERGVGADAPLQRYTQSSRSRNVDLTDPTTAKALANQVLGKILGRDANDDEIRSYTKALNDSEKANPRITDTRTKYVLRDDESGYDATTTSRSHGGVDAGQVMSNIAEDDPEAGAYQAATTYWNALEAALGTVGGNG